MSSPVQKIVRKPVLSRADIIGDIAVALKLPKSRSRAVLAAVLKAIKTRVAAGHKVELRGFATLNAKLVKAHKARNPQTGEAVNVTTHYVGHIKCSPVFLGRKKKVKGKPSPMQQKAC